MYTNRRYSKADVCHAYQILKNHGIPDDRIIVMMTDDIAYHKENPTPGIIINHPNGNDVYKGVPKDYTGSAVTSKNFMAILKGDKKALHGEGSGKVLESGPNDHVFIYFADHGTTGGLIFPDSADVCHAYQILKNHGIPDDRIIVMMTDDIAYHKENPTPGIIINHPNGNDVYKGVPKDYTGSAVTSKNFMAILKGDKKALHGEGSGKVLESGPNDHVFIYFADHGTTGGLIFPDS
ncbi:legumain, partial [Nephila pilipes]